jgi:hypothetical protein
VDQRQRGLDADASASGPCTTPASGGRVLYISGYTDDGVIRDAVLKKGLPSLQKPFTPDELARKAREVLDK